MTSTNSHHEHSTIGRVLTMLVSRPGRVLLEMAVLTAVLVAAGISLASDEEASFDPGGEVFETGELIERTFRASTTELLFIVEDENADALDLATLREWMANSEELRADAELNPAFST